MDSFYYFLFAFIALEIYGFVRLFIVDKKNKIIEQELQKELHEVAEEVAQVASMDAARKAWNANIKYVLKQTFWIFVGSAYYSWLFIGYIYKDESIFFLFILILDGIAIIFPFLYYISHLFQRDIAAGLVEMTGKMKQDSNTKKFRPISIIEITLSTIILLYIFYNHFFVV